MYFPFGDYLKNSSVAFTAYKVLMNKSGV